MCPRSSERKSTLTQGEKTERHSRGTHDLNMSMEPESYRVEENGDYAVITENFTGQTRMTNQGSK